MFKVSFATNESIFCTKMRQQRHQSKCDFEVPPPIKLQIEEANAKPTYH